MKWLLSSRERFPCLATGVANIWTNVVKLYLPSLDYKILWGSSLPRFVAFINVIIAVLLKFYGAISKMSNAIKV